MLLLLYYLSQNPDFPERVKPLMGQLKNSEEMLKFLNDLSRFSDIFSLFKSRRAVPTVPIAPPARKAAARMLRTRRPTEQATRTLPTAARPILRPRSGKKKIRKPRRAGSRMNLSNNVWKNILSVIEAGAPNCYKSGRRNPNPFRRRRDRSPIGARRRSRIFHVRRGRENCFWPRCPERRKRRVPKEQKIMPFKSVRA